MEPNNGSGEGTAPSKVVINGVEYEPQEAADLVNLGSRTRDAEKQYNTTFDKVWPEYGKLSQERSQWQKERETLQNQLSQFNAKRDAGVENADDVAKAKEAARKLGITLNEDLTTQGYVRREELDKYLEERERDRAAVQQVLDTAKSLEKEIDGHDGRPKFKSRQVLAYANTYGFTDLKKAYEEMNSDELKEWSDRQMALRSPKGLNTLKGGGSQGQPKPVKMTDDNVNAALHEVLSGGSLE